MLYKAVLPFESVDEIPRNAVIQMEATEQYCPVVCSCLIYRVGWLRPFDSVHWKHCQVLPSNLEPVEECGVFFFSVCQKVFQIQK